MSVLFPESTREACAMLAAHRDAVPMAGGTDLLVHWPQQHEAHRRTYLDLSKIAPLRRHEWTEHALVLGGLTTYWGVIQDHRVWDEFPLLIRAGRQVGAIQIQARGTWAGNIVNASPAADGVPVLMAYDAVVVLRSTAGTEEVRLDEFYLDYKKMRRRPEQLITAIRLPRREYDVEIFEKVGSRRAQAVTKVGLAITHSAVGWRVVANSMAATVRRCPTIEAMLEERRTITSPDAFLPAIRHDVAPIDDIRSTAAYRERVMARLLYFELKEVCAFIE